MRRTTQLLLVLLVAVATRAAAQGTASGLTITAVNRTAQREAAAGHARADEAVRLGDVIGYELKFTNVTGKAVRGVVLNDPVPKQFTFVDGSSQSSRSDVKVEYSTDGGESYSAHPVESVTVNGAPIRRPVSPERYTNVRWTIGGTVAPGATVTAQFEARFTALPRGAGTGATSRP